jgi:CelD/BcsL family acetyltransferase involved in cellulose biosynthesis
MVPSVNYLPDSSSLKILCATEDNELVGIAPFRITRKGLSGPFSYRVLEPLTKGETDYTGIIVTQQENHCLREFLAYLFSQKDWDFMHLPDLPQASPSLALFQNSSDIPKLQIEAGIICPFISIPKSKEEFLYSLNSKFQKKLKKSLKKLEAEQGKVELKQYQDIGSLEESMKVFFDLYQKRWGSKGDLGRFENKRAQNITNETAKYFAQKEWLKIYFLMVDNKPVSVELNLAYNGKMYCHLKGFDPDFSKYRVGSLLTMKVLEDCITNGFVEYDFMQGAEAYKFDWTSEVRRNITVRLVNKRTSSNLIDILIKVLNKLKIDLLLMKYIMALSSIRKLLKSFYFDKKSEVFS